MLPLRVAASVLLLSYGLCSASWAEDAAAPALDGAALFQKQCSACHTLDASAPPRQGPTLAGVYGRKPGTVPGFQYSPGFAKADFAWDESHLNAYLTNPQAVIPGAIMPYRQAKAPVREAIIAYLKGDPHS